MFPVIRHSADWYWNYSVETMLSSRKVHK